NGAAASPLDQIEVGAAHVLADFRQQAGFEIGVTVEAEGVGPDVLVLVGQPLLFVPETLGGNVVAPAGGPQLLHSIGEQTCTHQSRLPKGWRNSESAVLTIARPRTPSGGLEDSPYSPVPCGCCR